MTSFEKSDDLINKIREGICTTDTAGLITFVNAAFKEILGYDAPEDVLGKNFADFVTPESRIKILNTFARALEQESCCKDTEILVVGKEEEIIPVQMKYHPVMEDGRISGIAVIIRDISERTPSERVLAASEKKFRTIVDNMCDVVFIVDQTGRLEFISPSSKSLIGYEPSEIIGQSIREFIIEEDLTTAFSNLRHTVSNGTLLSNEYRIKHKNGSVVWIQTNTRPLFEENRVVAVQGSVWNITERKNAEEKLRNSEQEQRNLIENMPIACFKFDREGRILSWNRAAEEIYGYTKDEVIGRSAFDLILDPSKKDLMDRTILDVFTGKTVEGIEWQSRNKSGEIGWRMGNSFPLPSIGKEVKCGVNLNVDISEKKRAEQRLSRAYREIQKLNEQIRAENIYLQQEIRMTHLHGGIVGQSDAIKSVLIQAEQVAVTDSTVLILGETGTGKELLSRAIHNMSLRREHPFIVVNCAAIPDTLMESELFGRERGAYTGADTRQIGRFEIANGSTIFLDEIAELSMDMQGKLLRVLQEGQIDRLGSTQTIDIDVRVIAATNRDLEKEIELNRFREDLYYRLNVFPITLPPLRKRREDIPDLVRHFVNEMNQKMGKKIHKIPHQSIKALQKHGWPGNIRELHNVIERAMIQAQDTTLHIGSLAKSSSTVTAGRTLNEVQRQHILDVLDSTGWRVSGKNGAADALGLKPTTLESKLVKLGIKRPRP